MSQDNPFRRIINQLEAHYGHPRSPGVSDPLHLILWESIGYLVEDDRRETAFAALRKHIGLKLPNILSASVDQLVEITKLGGIHAELRAQRLKEIAHIVLNDFAGDLRTALQLPLPKAMKALKRFPSIGDPGAEKILLFTRTSPVLALESNGLRVLLRLGFGREEKNYSTTYRSAQTAVSEGLPADCEWLTCA